MYVYMFSHSVVSDSLWPRGLVPARLLCPWNFSGKNTGVGCHFLLQGIFPPQESNPQLLHRQANSLSLCHSGGIDHKHACISSLLSLPHPSRSSQGTRLSSLCHTAASQQLSIVHRQCMYVGLTLSICPTLSSPTASTSPFPTSASLFLPCK